MATLDEDFFPTARNPPDTQAINLRCLIRTQDGHRVVMVAGVVLAHYATGDRMAEAHAMVSLVEQGWADQSEVARAFGWSARTVRRDQRRYEDGGLAALGQPRGYPEGRARLTVSRRRTVQQLKAQGHSHCEIARRLGVTESFRGAGVVTQAGAVELIQDELFDGFGSQPLVANPVGFGTV